MARFRLKAKHYLPVPGTEWEQKEIDQTTGKQARKLYPVPRYLDPEDPSDCNYPGEIIVSTKASPAYPRDIVFTGPCSVDMEPLDDEAKAMYDEVCSRGEHPIESLSGTFGEELALRFERQVDALARNSAPAKPDARIIELEQQIAELKALVLAQAKPGIKIGA